MHVIKDRIIIKPDGVQSGLLDIIPTPFDFENQVLVGGAYDPHIARALYSLFFQNMYPTPVKGKPLFDWASLKPHTAITLVAAYNAINENMNKRCVKNDVPFVTISDEDIFKKISKTGVMSPNEIEERYSVVRSLSI